MFPAEIAPGFVWIVRLHPPATGEGWLVHLLSIVQRWLEAARLPWANVVYDGRRCLFHASSDVAQLERAATSIRGPSTSFPQVPAADPSAAGTPTYDLREHRKTARADRS